MQKLLNECAPWVNWKVAAVVGILLVGVELYVDWPSWGGWLAATPLLAIVICLLPCLIPFVWVWRKENGLARDESSKD